MSVPVCAYVCVYACAFLCVCDYVCVCVCVCVVFAFAPVCTYPWRPEINVRSLYFSQLYNFKDLFS
jgi:hypothetical protein